MIGCISRYQRRKRVDVGIDAMAHLEGDVRLVLAGEGETEADLRARAAPDTGIGSASCPAHAGTCTSTSRRATCCCSRPSPTEGAPRVITEGQLVGVPVIATDAPGTAGLICRAKAPSSHRPTIRGPSAAVLAAYRDDPERRRRESAAARRRAARGSCPQATVLARVEALLGLG